MRRSVLIDVSMIAALLLIGVAGYVWSPNLLPPVDVTASPDAGCDLHKLACGAALPGSGRLRFDLLPKPIVATEAMEVTVDIEGIDVDKVTIDFAGVSMNMGVNRQLLERLGNGRFAGRTMLSACVSGKMTWQATVLIESGRQRIAVPFHFDVGH